MIGKPMMIFVNHNCSYPIRGTPDTVKWVSSRTAKKGFVTTHTVFAEWLLEQRAGGQRGREYKRIIWVNNYSAHAVSDELKQQLSEKGTEIRYSPPNATHLVQPADFFVISKIKDAWIKRWEEKKLGLINNNQWHNEIRSDGSWSGALRNLGKNFFVQLAADSVRDVNEQRTNGGKITYSRKAMVRCGLAVGLDGKWSVEQLSAELQTVVAKHASHFLGEPVPMLTIASLVEQTVL